MSKGDSYVQFGVESSGWFSHKKRKWDFPRVGERAIKRGPIAWSCAAFSLFLSHWPVGQDHFSSLSAEDFYQRAFHIQCSVGGTQESNFSTLATVAMGCISVYAHSLAHRCCNCTHTLTFIHHLSRHRCLLPDQSHWAVKCQLLVYICSWSIKHFYISMCWSATFNLQNVWNTSSSKHLSLNPAKVCFLSVFVYLGSITHKRQQGMNRTGMEVMAQEGN